MSKEAGCLVRSGHASAGRELGLREQPVGGQDWMYAVEEALVSAMVLGPNLNVALSRGLSPDLPGSACSSHPASKHSVLSRAWAFSQDFIYTPKPGR